MTIDASIPLHGLLINRNDENLKQQQFLMGQMRMQDQQDRKASLADLMPKAAQGDQGAIDQLWAIDPNVAQHMDERQRQHAQAVTQDLSSAVRWADTPEKWAYVQQHYGQQGVDLSPYGFQDRERGLVALGQIHDYLQAPAKPDIRATEPGGGLYAIQPDGSVKVLVQPNDGSHQMGPSSGYGGDVPPGAADMLRGNPSLAPQFDEKYGPGAAQRILGGQTGAPSGGFL